MQSESLRVLIVEDEESDDFLVRREIERAGFRIAKHRRVDSERTLSEALADGPWDIAICDFNLPGFDGLEAIGTIASSGQDVPLLVVSGTVDEEIAGTVFRAGARDLVSKHKLARLGPAIRRELGEAKQRAEKSRVVEQLRNSEERFRAFMRALPALAWIEDASCRYTFVNEGWLAFFGKTEHEVLGHLAFEVHGADIGDRLKRNAERAIASHAPIEAEERLDDHHGTTRDLVLHLFPLGNETGLVGGVAFDLTERKRAEEAARASEEKFRAVADAASDAMITVDERGRVVFMNAAAERMLQRTEEEMLGRPLDDLLSPEARAGQAKRFALLLQMPERGPVPFVTELEMERKDGTRVPVELSVGSWMHESERFLTALIRDLTQKRQLEDQLRHAQKMEAIGQLAGGVAHDFNNLLSIITNYAELLVDDLPEGDSRRADVQRIEQAAQRGVTLVRQLLAFSRKQVLRPATISVNDLVRDTERMLRRLVGEKIDWRIELDPSTGHVRADASQIEQILINLVLNARDAMPKGGTLKITTRNGTPPLSGAASDEPDSGGRYVVLSVEDTGVGMDEETKRHIFDPFFTTKGVGKGTGLGLSTVYGIVEQSGGQIRVRSEPGRGTVFQIFLPRIADTVVADEGPSFETRIARPRGETIVLVEDDPDLRVVTARVLRREGYAVVELGRADDALAVVRSLRGRVDLVLTDVALPGMNGVELFDALREEWPFIPVLLMSGYAGTHDRGVELPADAPYLEKPIPATTLLAAIRGMLDEHAREATP